MNSLVLLVSVVLTQAGGADELGPLLRRAHQGPTLAEVQRVIPQPASQLEAIALDTKRFGIERMRAVDLLGEIKAASAVPALDSLARTGDLASLKRHSLEALARIDVARAHAAAVAMLSATDVHVRAAAVTLLGAHPSAAGQRAMERLMATEADPVVKKAANRSQR